MIDLYENELIDYYEIMSKEFPGVKLGMIESLGYFSITDQEGKFYPGNNSAVPGIDFIEFFNDFIKKMNVRGLSLDHFHVDFGTHAVLADGRRNYGMEDQWDFGRIHAVEQYIQSKGIKTGILISPGGLNKTIGDNIESDRKAVNDTIRYFSEYLQTGGRGNHLVLSNWHLYPEILGPESDLYTTYGMFNNMIKINEMVNNKT